MTASQAISPLGVFTAVTLFSMTWRLVTGVSKCIVPPFSVIALVMESARAANPPAK